ncbi:12671_t:CDS:2, partial [Entrophospora sp. SA101]
VKPDRPFRRRRHCSRNNKQASSLDQQQPVFLPISPLENYERYRPRIGSPLSTERTIEFNAGNEVNVTSLRFLQSPGLNTNKKGAEPQTSIIKAVNNRNNRYISGSCENNKWKISQFG